MLHFFDRRFVEKRDKENFISITPTHTDAHNIQIILKTKNSSQLTIKSHEFEVVHIFLTILTKEIRIF